MNNKIQKLYSQYEDVITDMSRAYKIPVPTILAVIQVETNDDDGFDKNGRLIIRFEIHKFMKYCEPDILDEVRSQFVFNEKKPWTGHKFRMWNEDEFKTFHGNQFNEHFVFNECRKMDDRAAHMCISMGLPQIMGFNYEQLDFNSPQEMFITFNQNTENQLQGMGRFFTARMRKDLRTRDFIHFAKLYNGSGQARKYGDMIEVAEGEIAAAMDY